MQIEFNTGRYYAPEGQIIKAKLIGTKIYFNDKTRHISGVLKGDFAKLTNDIVMLWYDRGWYSDCKYPE